MFLSAITRKYEFDQKHSVGNISQALKYLVPHGKYSVGVEILQRVFCDIDGFSVMSFRAFNNCGSLCMGERCLVELVRMNIEH